MKILTFDTSLNKTYITLCENADIICTKTIDSSDEKYHSAFLIPCIVEILKNNNLSMQDIKVIGTNIGPGSFTGIRVCTTIARIFAQQLNSKLAGISSMQILSKINNTDKNSIVLLDARKNKVYYAKYTADNQVIELPQAIEKESVFELPLSKSFVITDSSIQNFLKEHNVDCINYEENNYNLGKFLAEITLKEALSNNDLHWAKVKPLYIQPPSISKPKVY